MKQKQGGPRSAPSTGTSELAAARSALLKEAGLTERQLAMNAQIDPKTVRSYMEGSRATHAVKGKAILQELSKRLGLPVNEIEKRASVTIGDLHLNHGTTPSTQVGGFTRQQAKDALQGALAAWPLDKGNCRYPALLLERNEGMVFRVEYHLDDPRPADLRANYAILFIPTTEQKGSIYFDADRMEASERPAPQPYSLPFVTPAETRSLTLPKTGSIRVYVTHICRERLTPTVPTLLSRLEARRSSTDPRVRKDFSNWLELALTVATGLSGLHSHGIVHARICAESIVLREDRGWWRDITIITNAPGYGDQASQGNHGRWNDDLFDLGLLLVDVLMRGAKRKPRRIEFADHPETYLKEWKDDLKLDLPRRALAACVNYLLQPACQGPTDEKEWVAWSTNQLRLFLAELGALRTYRENAHVLATPSRREVDHGMRREGAVAAALSSLLSFVDPDEGEAWAKDYIRGYKGAEATDLKGAKTILALGFGRSAAATLERILAAKTLKSPEHIVAALRLLVGVLATREGLVERASEILKQWENDRNRTIAWWVKLLAQRIAADGETPKLFDLKSEPSGPDAMRAKAWRVSHHYLVLLKQKQKQKPAQNIGEDEISEITALIHGHASYEAIFGAQLLARASIQSETAEGFWRALRATLLAGSYSAVKKFPHEYAATLAISAHLIRFAATTTLRTTLLEQGTDFDECLVLAAECDLRAAEMYQQLDVPGRTYEALVSAARTLFLCSSPGWAIAGLRWLALARNHRHLAWTPGGKASTPALEKSFRAPRTVARSERASDVEQQLIETWRKDRKEELGTHQRDPGILLSENYYDLYGPGIEWAFGTGAVSVELPNHQEGGSVVDHLIDRAKALFALPPLDNIRILDIGCGTGVEALRMAAKGFDVVGIDSSAWNIARAKARLSGEPKKAQKKSGVVTFYQRDLLALDSRADIDGDRFDIVLLRDSLAHAANKLALLRKARERLKPSGVLVGADWVQKRPATRWQWQHLFETVWFASIESRPGLSELLVSAGFRAPLFFEDRHVDMKNFLTARHEWVENNVDDKSHSVEGRVVYNRARIDLKTLAKMAGDSGPLGWVFFWAGNEKATFASTEPHAEENAVRPKRAAARAKRSQAKPFRSSRRRS